MTRGFNHVGISVADLQRSIEFYRDLLGMAVVIEAPFDGPRYDAVLGLSGARGRFAILEQAGTSFHVELFEFHHPKAKPMDLNRPVCDRGITHFCLTVSNIYAEYERLSAAGVRFHCPPSAFEKTIATYARDPDGNVFELFEWIAD